MLEALARDLPHGRRRFVVRVLVLALKCPLGGLKGSDVRIRQEGEEDDVGRTVLC